MSDMPRKLPHGVVTSEEISVGIETCIVNVEELLKDAIALLRFGTQAEEYADFMAVLDVLPPNVNWDQGRKIEALRQAADKKNSARLKSKGLD